MIKTLLNSILFFWVSACVLINFVETAHPADGTLDESNFRILGLSIGDCAPRDVYSKFGPGIVFKDSAEKDETQVCYVSDKDETLFLFSFENSQCAGVRLLSQKMKFYKWHFCETSPLVSRHLATDSGIKLGISKSRLKTILGAPFSESDESLIYVYEWRLKRNTNEVTDRTIKAAITAEFSNNRLILFDVSIISQ